MDNYSLHNRMQKMFLLVGMLGFLLLPNTAAAEFVDEYVAKHPRRVKITVSQNAKGQYSGEALFKLFEHNVGGYRLKLDFQCDAKGPDLILLHCSTFGGRYTLSYCTVRLLEAVTHPPLRSYHVGTEKINMYFTSSSVFTSLLAGIAMVHFKSLISTLKNLLTLSSSAPIIQSL